MTFARSAFSPHAFQVGAYSGNAGSDKLDDKALADMWRSADRLLKKKHPEVDFQPVREVVKSVAKAAIVSDQPKKDRNRALRNRLRALEVEMNIAYIAMLDELERAYQLERQRRKINDEIALVLLLM